MARSEIPMVINGIRINFNPENSKGEKLTSRALHGVIYLCIFVSILSKSVMAMLITREQALILLSHFRHAPHAHSYS